MKKSTKKILIGVGIGGGVVVAAIVLAVVLLFVLLGMRTKNYWKYANPAGEIEKKYTALGSFDVEYDEYNAASDTYKKYEIWYPSEMTEDVKKYPLVIMANGTGTKASQYKEVFRHLASWGFIVAGNEDENSRTGASTAATLDYLLKLNGDSSSKFYGKIDTDNIGVAGHSQGGVGALNAVTGQPNGNKYKAVWAASATSRYHAENLNKDADGWTCYPSEINIPVFMVAGTGAFDAGNLDRYTATLEKGEAQGICPKWWLDECYSQIPDGVTKVVARQKDRDHGDMLRYADGYMTAWFMFHLKGEVSADFFSGGNAEIVLNKNWQDVKANSD